MPLPSAAHEPAERRLSRWLAAAEEGESEGGQTAALRAWRDAQLARDRAERRLRELERELPPAGAPPSPPPAEDEADHDGWAPRDLPLLPSPIYQDLLDEREPAEEAGAETSPRTVLASLPPPGTLPDLSYLPAWKRPLVRLLGRCALALGAFLAIPQRRINEKMLAALHELAAENAALRGSQQVLAERAAANFAFLDHAQRDQLIELHRLLARQRSEIRGEIARRLDDARSRLELHLEQQTPRHRLALVELELAVAEARSHSAWQRLVAVELDERVEAATAALAAARSGSGASR